MNFRSPIARLIPSGMDTEKIKRDGYHLDGIHGEKSMWKIMKMDELDALAITIERMLK